MPRDQPRHLARDARALSFAGGIPADVEREIMAIGAHRTGAVAGERRHSPFLLEGDGQIRDLCPGVTTSADRGERGREFALTLPQARDDDVRANMRYIDGWDTGTSGPA